MGRFLEPDPIGFMGGVNFYTYVGNNPVNFVDPWGWVCEKKTGTKIEVAGAGAAITASGGLLMMVAGQLGIPEITGYLVVGGWGLIGVGVVTVVVGPFIVGNSQGPNFYPQPLPSHGAVNRPSNSNNLNKFIMFPAH